MHAGVLYHWWPTCSYLFCRHGLQSTSTLISCFSRYIPSSQPWLRPSLTCLSDGWFGWIHQKHLFCNRMYHSSWLQVILSSEGTIPKSIFVWVDSGGPSNLPFCAQVVVLLVLLVWWMDLPSSETSPYQVVEYFSGVGRIAMLSRYCGFTTAALDIEYGMQYAKENGKRSPMDINSSAGLVLLACFSVHFVLLICVCWVW